MGSSKNYSAGAGVTDVAHIMLAFQEINSCILSVSLEVTMRSGAPGLSVKILSFTIDRVTAERVPLASSQFGLSQHGFKTLEAAIIYGLYQIDAKIAAAEMEGTKP